MKVLNTLSLLIERTGVAIQSHVSSLLQYLPQLWIESADMNSSMLRCIIISTLNNIVKGLGPLSVSLHSFILPVLQLATNVKEVSKWCYYFRATYSTYFVSTYIIILPHSYVYIDHTKWSVYTLFWHNYYCDKYSIRVLGWCFECCITSTVL